MDETLEEFLRAFAAMMVLAIIALLLFNQFPILRELFDNATKTS